MIEGLGLTDRVIPYPYYIPDHEVKYFFSACDLVVLPYRTATQSGIAKIALNFEKPILISDVGGLPETVVDGYNGFITASHPTGFARGIQRFILQEENLYMRDYIQDKQEQFSWRTFTEKLTSAMGIEKLQMIPVD